MRVQWLRTAQGALIGVALIAGCNREGGPAPEVPALYAGNGGMSGGANAGSSGTGGGAGNAGEGGQAGQDSGGAGGTIGGGNGGTGGLAGLGGVGGFSGAGMGGTGGAGGTGVSDSCTDSDAVSTDLPFDPNAIELSQLLTKGTTSGSNGTFVDSCTESGDLLEHVCETQFTCGGQSGQSEGACAPSPQLTGMVLEVNRYCFGLCVDGVCNVPCPVADDELTVAQVVGASVHFESSAGVRYACTLDACLAFAPNVGDTLTVDSSPVPNDTQLDCSGEFASADAPLFLSDGCSYSACTVQPPVVDP